MQTAEAAIPLRGISTLKNLRALSARRISTSAEKSQPLDSVAPPATILNDIPTFSVGRAFLDLHCLLACDAVHQIDEGAFIVIQMMPSRLHFFTFSPPPTDADARTAISRSVGVDSRLFLHSETPNRIANLRTASGDRFMRCAISSADRDCAARSSKRRSSL